MVFVHTKCHLFSYSTHKRQKFPLSVTKIPAKSVKITLCIRTDGSQGYCALPHDIIIKDQEGEVVVKYYLIVMLP